MLDGVLGQGLGRTDKRNTQGKKTDVYRDKRAERVSPPALANRAWRTEFIEITLVLGRERMPLAGSGMLSSDTERAQGDGGVDPPGAVAGSGEVDLVGADALAPFDRELDARDLVGSTGIIADFDLGVIDVVGGKGWAFTCGGRPEISEVALDGRPHLFQG